MANFKSGLFKFGRSGIVRALAISLSLHAMLLLQNTAGVSSLWSQRGLTAAGNSLDATLRKMAGPAVLAPALLPHTSLGAAPASPGKPLPVALPPEDDSASHLPSASAGTSEIDAAARRSSGDRDTLALAGSAAVAAPLDAVGVDAGRLRQYRLSLAVESRRFKRYPPEALEQGWSGTVHVRVAIPASGVHHSVQLVNSCGHEALDAVALEMAHEAALNAAVPSSLRGRAFSVSLPVVFSLEPD